MTAILRSIAVLPSRALLCAGVWLGLWALVFRDGVRSMVELWLSNETYTHSMFVLPVAAYFAWRERARMLAVEPAADYRAAPAILLVILGWAVGYAAGVQLFIHAAMLALIPLSLLLVLGYAPVRALGFSVIFMFFALPVGEELTKPFQNITADMSVHFLNLVNVPVYREGLYLRIPNGLFQVAEACSGVRFFVASLCFGVLYTHITYTVWWKRIAFLLMSLVVPIIANGVRAFGTIYVGYLSDMRYAVGVDHLFYGWLFFAIVILILIAIGERWRDPVPRPQAPDPNAIAPKWRVYPYGRSLAIALLPLAIIAAWSVAIDTSRRSSDLKINSGLLAQVAPERRWIADATTHPWLPQYPGADSVHRGLLGANTALYVAFYNADREGAELVTSANQIFQLEGWSEAARIARTLGAGTDDLSVTLLDLRSVAGSRRLLVYWYVVEGYAGGSATRAKLHQAADMLSGGSGAGAVIAFSQEYSGDQELALADLLAVIERYRDAVRSAIPIK